MVKTEKWLRKYYDFNKHLIWKKLSLQLVSGLQKGANVLIRSWKHLWQRGCDAANSHDGCFGWHRLSSLPIMHGTVAGSALTGCWLKYQKVLNHHLHINLPSCWLPWWPLALFPAWYLFFFCVLFQPYHGRLDCHQPAKLVKFISANCPTSQMAYFVYHGLIRQIY